MEKTDRRPTTVAELLAGAEARRDEPRRPDTREEIEARLAALKEGRPA